MSDIQYIDNHADLVALCQTLGQSPWLALDTEFHRERTYYPQLCLVQIADSDTIACIDPLAIDDLSPLYQLLHNPEITKVLHSAVQDQEILFQASGRVPAPVFDTQIAASLQGYGDQVGYAKLVEEICQVQLDKSQSRTDWCQRPLKARQIDYAADDVRYLRDIYQKLVSELSDAGREAWLARDFAELSDPDRFTPNPAENWRKVKQFRRLRPNQLVVLQALAEWREERAMEKDKPRKWIASDDLLIDLARSQPANIDEMSGLRSASEGFVRHQGHFVLDLIQSARQRPKSEWPSLPDYQPLSPNQEAQVDYLMGASKLVAGEHNITTSSLVTRKQLEKLVQGDRDIPLMKSWRHSVLGQRLDNLLNQTETLALHNGVLALIEKD
ncbi:MAG: ribonuclease D [Pseudomonadota bacterium]